MNMKKLLLIYTLTLFYVASVSAEDEKVLLKTEIPKPPFIDEVVSVPKTNMEPPLIGGKREFYVPLGTTNLALHKPVTASAKPTVGNLNQVTDGDKDGDDGGWIEFPEGNQWVQIDLQKTSEIYAVLVWHYYYKSRVYLNVVAAVSNDPEFKKDVKVIFNNDIENAIGLGKGSDYNYVESHMGKLIDAKGVKGRYVRLYSNGNFANKMNHYVEVEVFGRE
jgi:hypothetical protein